MVSEFAGFPHEGFVLQFLACYLLVDVLQANEKRPVTKPEAIRARKASQTTAAVHRAFGGGNGDDYRGDCASAIHMRSMLQASRGR